MRGVRRTGQGGGDLLRVLQANRQLPVFGDLCRHHVPDDRLQRHIRRGERQVKHGGVLGKIDAALDTPLHDRTRDPRVTEVKHAPGGIVLCLYHDRAGDRGYVAGLSLHRHVLEGRVNLHLVHPRGGRSHAKARGGDPGRYKTPGGWKERVDIVGADAFAARFEGKRRGGDRIKLDP